MNDLSDVFSGDALGTVISKVAQLNTENKQAKKEIIAKATRKQKKKIEQMQIDKPIIVGKNDSLEDMQATKINWFALTVALVGPEKEIRKMVTVVDEKGNKTKKEVKEFIPYSADECFHLLGVERKNNMTEAEL